MAILIRRRRDTKANWASVDPIIPTGQLAFELGTAEGGAPRIKIGNGTDVYSALPYINRKNNLTAVSDPAVTNNATEDYSVGSTWVNTSGLRGFVLTSFSGANAIWTPWGGLIRSITQIQGVPPFPNDGYDYVLVENSGTLTWELYTTGGGGAVDSVNGQTGVVVLTLEDIDDVPPYPNDGYQYILAEENGVLTWELNTTGGVTSVNGLTGIVVLNLDDINDVPAYPNDGYQYILTEDSGVLTWELFPTSTIPQEEEIEGTALYDATLTGTENLDLATFTAFYGVLTGNTDITVTNTPATGESFVRSLKIQSYATESLTLPVGWEVIGTYAADGSVNDIQIEFSNFPTIGLTVTAYINQWP